ncbi:uncharacterized protein YbaP (TraB family) [Herbaspirillum rubrisubalbicans]|uniref:TraB/GumN family protein n=1 Tax=Herbaspirillum rubrisubalbicans TaxID=80842 RepID=UPI0020A11437|nr:TraB/GumN family protein [Herbaspirillum rubrisubalbicans]MCP1574052.1 uncharacterized protein YbaP (TraB family) [Herbaspirillum rubrisubalbicans]
MKKSVVGLEYRAPSAVQDPAPRQALLRERSRARRHRRPAAAALLAAQPSVALREASLVPLQAQQQQERYAVRIAIPMAVMAAKSAAWVWRSRSGSILNVIVVAAVHTNACRARASASFSNVSVARRLSVVKRQNMKKLWPLFVLASVIFIMNNSAMGQSIEICPPPGIAPADELQRLSHSVQPDRGPLWEITRDGTRSYLYGTIHVAKLEWDFPGPTIRKALNASRKLVVEIDVTKPGLGAAMNAPMATEAAERSSALYQSLVSRIDEQFRKACINQDRFKGSTLASMVSSLTLLSARKQGLYPEFSIDASLIGFARYTKKEIVELETPEDQRTAIGASDLAALERDVIELESGKARENLENLARVWASGNLGDMERYCESIQCTQDRNYFDTRNRVFAAGIDKLANEKEPAFIAVGFLHMIGPDNVLDKLKELGFQVRQIPTRGEK